MKSLQDLKKETTFNNEMHDLIDILRKTAVAQFQVLFSKQKALSIENRFTKYLNKMFNLITYEKVRHPIFTNPKNRVLLIMMTTDMGFLGGVNTKVIESGLNLVGPRDVFEVVVVGEKGRDHFVGASHNCVFLPGVTDGVKFDEVTTLRDYIFATSIREKFGRVLITYPKFFSFAHQKIETLQLIPCDYLFKGGSKKPPSIKIKSKTEGNQEPEKEIEPPPVKAGPVLPEKIIYEPFLDKVVDYLIRAWLAHHLYHIYWHSKLSELASRSMHLDESLSELSEMKTTTRMQYLKVKHELTDRNTRDIFGGRIVTLRKKQNASS
ncbi:MAG: F0F1 ATP synthase subunit gamma [Planctomycetes bacterium]|nr:F0F1 ATP synthase subunit gamma [Planctomycetota bacterium]MCK5579267.1 F0F1 ATP synthase subunit gamma [Planctomycetota bacterium]